MNERMAAVAKLEERFGEFVTDHARVGQRWEIMDRRPLEPFDFVLFSHDEDEDGQADGVVEHFPPFFANTMEIYMKRTAAERERDPKTIPSVLVEQQATGFQLLDPYVRLYDVVPDYKPTEAFEGWAIATLLDRLEGLAERAMFVAAGRRTFPDDSAHPIA